MNIDEPRVTEYALGELHGRAREEFEKELAQSHELQRELEGTVIFCQKLGSLPSGQEGFDDQTRAKLQAECLRNVQAIRQRRHRFRRAAMLGAVGAIAACLLIALVVPWAANYQRPLAQTNTDSEHLLVKSRPSATPALLDRVDAPSQMVASAKAVPALVPSEPTQVDRKLTVRAGGSGQPAASAAKPVYVRPRVGSRTGKRKRGEVGESGEDAWSERGGIQHGGL